MRRIILAILFLSGVVAVFGCAQVRDDEVGRPWAQPEPWERNMGLGPIAPE